MGAVMDMQHGGSNSNMPQPLVGLGLRHAHYADALTSAAPIDFVELHSENFFSSGGAIQGVLENIQQMYPISLHSTALGLGSAEVPEYASFDRLNGLVNKVQPILVSDHASYSWGTWDTRTVHAGDLLPLSFNPQSLQVLAQNVDKAQQALGRRLLIENLSSYIWFNTDSMPETEFLVRLTELTGCGLLVDLNNIIVSGHNLNEPDIEAYASSWLRQIPTDVVGEIHLAGFTKVKPGELVVDDHSQKVSASCWTLYADAIKRFGAVPTLIEWDNKLPQWDVLLREVKKARRIAKKSLTDKQDGKHG